MKVDELHQNLLSIIRGAIPQDRNLAYTLAEILCLGREAIYRRLRGEVPFSFYEIATISEKLNISIDNIIGRSIPNTAVFNMDKGDFLNPSPTHYGAFRKALQKYYTATSSSWSELGFSGNLIPAGFTMKYDWLTRFKSFKWMYQNKRTESIKPFSEIKLPKELLDLHKEYGQIQTEIKSSFYTWDGLIFSYIVNDIKYFHHIHLISREDVQELKKELLQLINELEIIATRGKFETGNKVQLYISSLNFDTNYTYIKGQNFYFSLINIFVLNGLLSSDKDVFDSLTNLVKAQQRFSTLISETGEAQRVQFFNEQREAVKSL